MSTILEDGNFVTATVHGAARLSAPLPHTNTDYLLEQDYQQNFDNFSPLALNTSHDTLPTYKLVEETPLQDVGCGVAQWIRRYAKVPDAHDEFETYGYNFIGIWGTFTPGVAIITGRDRFTKIVQSRLANIYYLIGTGGTYATAGLIPIIPAQLYYYGANPLLNLDYLTDSPPFAVASNPSRAQYQTLVNAAVSDVWTTTNGQIVAQESSISRWMGNIWRRTTRYVLAI